jgi:methionyl-tRNA synthetase
MEEFGTDALRFYLMRDVAFGSDGAVGMEAVKTRYESELANEYGNLASRTIAMVARYRDGVVPEVERDPALEADLSRLPEEVAALMDRAEPTRALDRIWQRVRRLNRYVEEQAPWTLARDPASAEQLDRTLASLVEGLRTVNTLLEPYMPATSEKLRLALGARGGAVSQLEPLFPKRA